MVREGSAMTGVMILRVASPCLQTRETLSSCHEKPESLAAAHATQQQDAEGYGIR